MKASLLLCLLACGGTSTPSVSTRVTATLAVGCEVALVSSGDFHYAFDRENVTVLREGAVVVRTGAPMVGGQPAPWEAAAAIAGPDGSRWAVGLADGALWRVTEAGQIEAVSARLGIGRARVAAIAADAGTFVLALENGVAVSRDSVHLERFRGSGARHVAAAADTIAIVRDAEVEVFDLAGRARRTYPIRGVRALAFIDVAATPRLVVATAGELYVERDAKLHRVASPSPRSLVSSGDSVWLLANDAVYLLEDGALAKTSIRVAKTNRMFVGDHGATWLAGAGKLTRHARAPSDDWDAEVRPVFERGCVSCHGPRGVAGLDLSTAAAWTHRRHRIQQSLTSGAMPPPGHPFSDSDRARMLAWLSK